MSLIRDMFCMSTKIFCSLVFNTAHVFINIADKYCSHVGLFILVIYTYYYY